MSDELPNAENAQAELEGQLRWVVCPVCHAGLRVEDGAIRCVGCGRRYPVVDGIPVLLAECTS